MDVAKHFPNPELYRVNFQIERLVLNTTPETTKRLIKFRLPNSVHFEESSQIARKRTIYSPGKILHLPISSDCPQYEANISVTDGEKELANAFIPNIISNETQSFDLFDSGNKTIGEIRISIKGFWLGPSLNEILDKDGSPVCLKPLRPFRCFESASNTPKPIATDKLVFHAKKTTENGMILELTVPRTYPLPILPPYHEDIGVQTDFTGKHAKKSKSIKKL